MDAYVAWMKEKNLPLYEAGGTWWEPYQKALVPAAVKPEPVEISARDAKEMLRKSGTLFLRHFTRTYQNPTDFWYVACDEYDFCKLSKKTRACIRRGLDSCTAQRVDPAWLANNGFDCYAAAFARYRNAHPVSRLEFEKSIKECAGGPFDFWAVFCQDKIATFCKCVVGADHAAVSVLKSHPAYLQFYPVYVLMDTMLKCYLEEHKEVSFGFRSIAHETNIQDFLEKFGFDKVYCDLKIVYRPSVRVFVSALMPFKSVLDRFPNTKFTSRFKGVLAQEEIRRSFLQTRGKCTLAPDRSA
jgi:hypothetical protein